MLIPSSDRHPPNQPSFDADPQIFRFFFLFFFFTFRKSSPLHEYFLVSHPPISLRFFFLLLSYYYHIPFIKIYFLSLRSITEDEYRKNMKMKKEYDEGSWCGSVDFQASRIKARRSRRAAVWTNLGASKCAPGNGYASVVIRGRTSAAQLIFSLQLHPQSFRVSVVVPGRPLISKRRWWLVEQNVPLLVNKYFHETVENPLVGASSRFVETRSDNYFILFFFFSHRWNLMKRSENGKRTIFLLLLLSFLFVSTNLLP